jgi:5-formyltetrahydrofolate cyclo-ligase
MESNNRLTSYYYSKEKNLIENKFGILEPTDTNTLFEDDNIDIFIIPLLAFDNKGNRIGYGGGYYDNYLKKFPNSIKIGVSLEEAIDNKWNGTEHDMKLDYCITETKIYKF